MTSTKQGARVDFGEPSMEGQVQVSHPERFEVQSWGYKGGELGEPLPCPKDQADGAGQRLDLVPGHPVWTHLNLIGV